MLHSANYNFADDYARLSAPLACTIEQLRYHFRRAVRALHPDRNPALANDVDARDQLLEVTSAFRRLEDFHRQQGRLPLEPLRVSPSARTPARPNPALHARRPLRTWRWISATLMILAFAWLYPWADRADAGLLNTVPEVSTFTSAAVAQHSDQASIAGPDAGTAVRIGYGKSRVRQILGAPILAYTSIIFPCTYSQSFLC